MIITIKYCAEEIFVSGTSLSICEKIKDFLVYKWQTNMKKEDWKMFLIESTLFFDLLLLSFIN